LKTLYGLVQAERKWWEKLKEVMKTIKYYPSHVDPCLFINTSTTKHLFVIINVDDGENFSTKDNIDKLIQALNKDFKVKHLGPLEHFVGCHVIENVKRDTIWIRPPKLIKHLKESYSDLVKTTRVYKTPRSPKTTITRPKEDNLFIS
jgi:Reverse transcriptase (RNA-dependent DNA polymerase)